MSGLHNLATTARDLAPAGEARLDDAIKPFESVFFNNMVLVLDNLFCHREVVRDLVEL